MTEGHKAREKAEKAAEEAKAKADQASAAAGQPHPPVVHCVVCCAYFHGIIPLHRSFHRLTKIGFV